MKQIIILFVFFVFSCENHPNSSLNSIPTNSCNQLEQQVKQLKLDLNSQYKGYIGHDVYLKLKNLEDMPKVTDALYSLKNVNGVEAIKVGPFKNLGDKRALNYDVKMQMYFKNETAYKFYNKDSTHLNVRAQLGSLLASPPASFDFIVK